MSKVSAGKCMNLQEALISAGLTTQQKINKINRQKAIDEAFTRVAVKALEVLSRGPVRDDDDQLVVDKYRRLKRRASKNLQFAY